MKNNILTTSSKIIEILEKSLNQEPLGIEDGVSLFKSNCLPLLGLAADCLRKEQVGDLVTFVVDRNINYTNVCISECKFCAFYREEGSPEAYVLSKDDILQKIDEAVGLGATQILLQGGLHPDLPIEYYEEMLKAIKKYRVQVHAFSPPEIVHISKIYGASIKETLLRLRASGLDSIPGGGAEILEDRIRRAVSPNKIGWKKWAEVMEIAHSLGIPSTATMVFGHLESLEDRVRHILRIKEIQEKTHGFTAFIPWSFQPTHTQLLREGVRDEATGVDYLRLVAVSRLLLGEYIKNIQVSWVTQGHKIAQIALNYGANDFGGTMIEENVVRAAGVSFKWTEPEEIIRLIKKTGRPAAKRDTLYNILERY